MTDLDSARRLVLARAHGRCEGCGLELTLEVHHRQPRGMGGVSRLGAAVSNAVPNLLALGRVCHDLTEAEPTACRDLGWLVPHPIDSWTVPALLRTVNGYGWYRLELDATYTWVDPVEAERLVRDLYGVS